MSSARKLHLPKQIDTIANTRGDVRLHNEIISFLSNNSLSFPAGVEETSGKQIVVGLQKTLFYLEPHLKTFNGRQPHFILTFFQPLLQTVHIIRGPMVMLSNLWRTKMESLTQSLFDLLSLPAISTSRWHAFKSALEELSFNLSEYVSYLKSQSERVADYHLSKLLFICQQMALRVMSKYFMQTKLVGLN